MNKTLWLLLLLNGALALAWAAGFSLPATALSEPPAPAAKRLRLLSELPALPPRIAAAPQGATPGDAGAAPAAGPAPADAPAPLAAASEPRESKDAAAAEASCYRTAPLAGDAYEAAGARLRQAGLGEPVLQPQGRARPRYWVYWAGSAEAASQVEQRLRAAGLRDWYRQRAADGTLRISLGIYGQLDSARRRQRELAARGIQTQIGERYPPQARLRWMVNAPAAAVAAARDGLRAAGLQLEACP